MTQQEYKQKKRECWEEFCDKHLFDPHNIVTQGIFCYAFDCAHALDKQEKDAEESVIQGWVARNENGVLIAYNKKPIRQAFGDCLGWFGHLVMLLDESLFLDITWDSDPLPVDIIIKRKKK